MLFIQGTKFLMGSNTHYPEEAPAQEVSVDPFWMDETPVTNAQFAKFVDDTHYVTLAERVPHPADYPGILPSLIQPGSLLFRKPDRPVSLQNPSAWWEYSIGSCWKAPCGPVSSISSNLEHPVVHVAYEDCEAYARWAGKSLPTEAEWECAARGGLDGMEYAWGEELHPRGERRANIWEGRFPWECLNLSGTYGTTPVHAYPPNGIGLYDMIGNVWEWTCDWYEPRRQLKQPDTCCIPRNPRGGREEMSHDPCMPEIRIGRKVLKGGSHLCAANYCRRYRPAARYAQPMDTSTSHVGFRCVVRSQI
jgi:formylglycine-generating enzyme